MFTKSQVDKVLTALSNNTKCFVSEKHLQTSFIIEAAKQNKKCKFFPEYAVHKSTLAKSFINSFGQNSARFDLMILNENETKTLIEFKYKTKEFNDVNNELPFEIELTNQAAYNLAEYDIWKDISRIEEMIFANNEYVNGFVVFVTNDLLYPNGRNQNGRYGRNFSVVQGKHVKGLKMWDPKPIPKAVGTNRMNSIKVKNEYCFDYQNFSSFPGNKNGEFKSIVIEIK